ncbi:MAG: hypothetical protein II964_03470 [Synergistaceae bacterium]|nr:hypothetical protein [Synergistaceae bacterium]
MIFSMRLHPFYQTNGGASGIKRGGGGGQAVASGDMVRGVPQSQIDQLRGTRDHQPDFSMTWETVRDDYARVGIAITEQEARDIALAVNHYTYQHDTKMRKAWNLEQAGRVHDLTPELQKELADYKLIAEYCKVAPVLPSSKYSTVYRGIKNSTITPQYSQAIYALKVGDSWNVDGMPTSFSTEKNVARGFAGYNGIIMHMPTKGMKNTPSMKGFSVFPGENEVFVTDYNWKVARISDQRQNGDGFYHIYLDKP